jgi:hypothetical protein
MDDTIISTYYLCGEFLSAAGHRDDPQAHISTAEVMSTALSSRPRSSAATSRGPDRSLTSTATSARRISTPLTQEENPSRWCRPLPSERMGHKGRGGVWFPPPHSREEALPTSENSPSTHLR